MLTTILVVLLVIASFAITVLGLACAGYVRIERMLNQDLIDLSQTLSKANHEVGALEEGMTEMQENYEVDFIGFKEQLETKDKYIDHLHAEQTIANDHIRELNERLEAHQKFCLPVLNEIRDLNP